MKRNTNLEIRKIRGLIIEDFENENNTRVTYDRHEIEELLKKENYNEETMTKVFYMSTHTKKELMDEIIDQANKQKEHKFTNEDGLKAIIRLMTKISDIPFNLNKKSDVKALEEILLNDAEEYNRVFQILSQITVEEYMKVFNEVVEFSNNINKLPVEQQKAVAEFINKAKEKEEEVKEDKDIKEDK